MHYRRLGKAGIKISEVSLGSWVTFGNQVDVEAAKKLLKNAFELGVNFFDNADIYASGSAEKIMGEAIKALPRPELVISSKVFWPTMPGPNGRGLSRKHIMESIDASLQRLQLDYLDLYFCHRYDPDTPIEEVVFTMNTLIQQGKILYWGTSEWTPAQITRACGIAEKHHLIPPAMEQPQYNMFHRSRVEAELAPICKELGIGLTTFSPLMYGILTGKYNKGIPKDSRASIKNMAWIQDYITEEHIEKVGKLEKIALKLGITTAQLAIAWLLRRKEVSSVITGASKLSHLKDNLKAVDAVELLTEDILDAIEDILDNQPDA